MILDQEFQNQLLIGDQQALRSVTFIGKPIVKSLYRFSDICKLIQEPKSGYIHILTYNSLLRFDRVRKEVMGIAGSCDPEYAESAEILFTSKI